MKTLKNETTGIMEAYLPAKLNSIGEKKIENSNGNEYQIANCTVTYPDNSKEIVSSVIWTRSVEAGVFAIGGDVTLRVQIEGDYAGNAVVELSNNRVDVSKLSTFMPVKKDKKKGKKEKEADPANEVN